MPSAVRCLPDRWATVRWIYGGRAHEVEGTDGNSRTDRATDPAREGAAPPPHARAALEELFGEPASSPAGATLRQRWSRRSRTAHAGSAPGSRRPTWVTRRWTSCSTTCAASSSPTCSGPGSCLRVPRGAPAAGADPRSVPALEWLAVHYGRTKLGLHRISEEIGSDNAAISSG